MDGLPKVDAKSLLPLVREQIEAAVAQVMQAVNDARPGELITGSEEAARNIGHELTRVVYEAALQQRITAAEAAFPPSTGRDDGSSVAQ